MMFDPLLKTALLRIVIFLLLASISAWFFVLVEYRETDDKDEKYKLLLSLYELLEFKYNMSIEEFNNISNAAYEALSEPKPRWIFSDAITFIFHAWTTIGYGNITPQTPTGQVMCIFISLLGIPVTLLTLKSIGELIAKWVHAIVTKFETTFLKRSQPKHMQTKSAVVLFSIMVLSVLTGGLLLMRLPDWSFVEGVYFWFVTLTTIGFGDFVLREPRRIKQFSLNFYVNEKNERGVGEMTSRVIAGIFSAFSCILALCIVSSVLNSIMAALEEWKCRPPRPGCCPRKTQDHVEPNQHCDTAERRESNTAYFNFGNYAFQKDVNIVSLSETELK